MKNNSEINLIEKSLIDSSYKFALKIVKLVQQIQNDKKEFTLSKLLLRTGTTIGALLTEVKFIYNKQESLEKLNYALSDVYKTKYWMTLLLAANYINQNQYKNVMNDCRQIYQELKTTIEKCKEIIDSK